MRVSKLWYTIVTGICALFKLGTITPRDAVARTLEWNQWLLDVVIDTEFDRGDFTPPQGAYWAILAAIRFLAQVGWVMGYVGVGHKLRGTGVYMTTMWSSSLRGC